MSYKQGHFLHCSKEYGKEKKGKREEKSVRSPFGCPPFFFLTPFGASLEPDILSHDDR
jgi:hypothetical protein